jgi:hypothetical protein
MNARQRKTYSAVRCSRSISFSCLVLSLSSYSRITPVKISNQKISKRRGSALQMLVQPSSCSKRHRNGINAPATEMCCIRTWRVVAQQEPLQFHLGSQTEQGEEPGEKIWQQKRAGGVKCRWTEGRMSVNREPRSTPQPRQTRCLR